MKCDEEVLLIPQEPDRDIQTQIATSAGSSWSEQATCQVELLLGTNQWTVRCRDQDGKLKCQGGDELYIRYEEYSCHNLGGEDAPSCQAVALLQDHEDGTYLLDFVSTPMCHTHPVLDAIPCSKTKRILTVYLEYTNGIGKLPSPTKNDWSDGGYSHRCFTTIVSVRPSIRSFTPPPCTIDLGSFDQILAFGDSTMDQFVRQRPNQKGKYYFHPNILVGEKLRQRLNSKTVHPIVALLENDFGKILRECAMEGKSVCLLLGSCLWDILDSSDTMQGSDFEDHIQACREYILQVRKRYQVTVAWKSPMAVHIHWVDMNRLIEHDRSTATLFGRDRVRYMSSSRSKSLYKKQCTLMEEMGVPLLDIYEASYLSADQLFPADGRHYRPDLNRLMLSWFTPNASRNEKYYQNLPR